MELDLKFRNELPELEEAGKTVLCFQCGSCVADCPASSFSAGFNPRKIVLGIILGDRELVGAGSPIWECTTCYTCAEVCPQEVSPTEAITALKNVSTEKGTAPENVRDIAEAIKSTDSVIAHNKKIESMRAELGLDSAISREGGVIRSILSGE